MASDSHGSGDEDGNGEEYADLLILFYKYLCCVLKCDKQCALKTMLHRSMWALEASLPPPSPSFFTTTYPPRILSAPHQPVEMSHQPLANHVIAHSSQSKITGVFMLSDQELKIIWITVWQHVI